jgi:hypothetical protein
MRVGNYNSTRGKPSSLLYYCCFIYMEKDYACDCAEPSSSLGIKPKHGSLHLTIPLRKQAKSIWKYMPRDANKFWHTISNVNFWWLTSLHEPRCIATGPDHLGSIPGRGKIFSLLRSAHVSSEVYPAYLMDTVGSFPEGKVAGARSLPLTSI